MRHGQRRRGQVIVMVTLALIMMCGVLGLAVDLGWGYYVEKTTQAAADAAAIAAVSKAFTAVGGAGATPGAYSTQDSAPTPVPCSSVGAGGALAEGCLYAQRNGFTDTGRQTVTMAANADSVPPTATRVGSVMYWATARVAERIPQLFSAVLGNTMGGAGSRATAAVIWSEAPGSLYALDRQFDYGTPSGGIGNDLFIQGGGSVRSGGDVYLASTAGGTGNPPGQKDYYASEGLGGWEVWSETGATYIRTGGWSTAPQDFYVGPDKVQQNPSHQPEGDQFLDPLRGKGQPPPPPAGLADCAIVETRLGSETVGVISAAVSPVWGPGNYYTVDAAGNATGNRLLVQEGVTFGSGGSCSSGSAPRTFGNYVFFGGMILPNGMVTFDPGRYVFAGVRETTRGNPGILLDGRTQAYMQDRTPPISGQVQPNTDAGEIFIFTDPNYRGGPMSETRLTIPGPVQAVASQLKYGVVDLQAGGAGGKSDINLHGLYAKSGALPQGLEGFDPVVFWQDQRNSTVRYTPDGYYGCGQVSGAACASGRTIDQPDWTGSSATDTNGSPEMNLQATPSNRLFGVVYQPRGAWVILHGGQTQMSSPLQLISGAYEIRGGASVLLQPALRPMTRQVVALVE